MQLAISLFQLDMLNHLSQITRVTTILDVERPKQLFSWLAQTRRVVNKLNTVEPKRKHVLRYRQAVDRDAELHSAQLLVRSVSKERLANIGTAPVFRLPYKYNVTQNGSEDAPVHLEEAVGNM